MPILTVSLFFGMGDTGFATSLKFIQGRMYIEGQPFHVKGVNYNPVPIGIDPKITPPFGDYFTFQNRSIYNRDLPLLREMGANTIRIWDYNHDADHTDFLDKAYNNGVRSIYVVLSFVFNPTVYPDIHSAEARKKIKSDFRAMVAQYKNHPAILMWAIGNELNAPDMYQDRLRELFPLLNEMAMEVHAEEGLNFHPIVVSLADLDLMDTVSTYEPLAPDVDIWGVNMNRGDSFGTLFKEYRRVSAKPLLIMGFGIDAYDEKAGDEYENIGPRYQAIYAESLWKEIAANSDICVGGIIRSYSDEWWLGKYGNTLGGCPDLDPGFQSRCGHPSDSDPDGFVNYEWFGLMRSKKSGSELDIVEPREIYYTLKSLWTAGEIRSRPAISGKISKVPLSVKPLDLTKDLTVEELMAAGQLGGPLHPTHEIGDKERGRKINLSFGEAIDRWNRHEYKRAIKLFKDHIEQYPDSPWASEAVLHMGCDAQYNGRYTEAEKHFKWILERHKGQNHEGAKVLMNKARLRLATLKVNQNNFKEARELFAQLHQESSD